MEVDGALQSTPRLGGRRKNKKLATRPKASTRRCQPPVLVPSSPSPLETLPETRPAGEDGKSVVTPAEKGLCPSPSTVAAAAKGEDGAHPSKSGFPLESTPLRFSDSPAAPPLPSDSGGPVQAPSLIEKTGDPSAAPFFSPNLKFDAWIRQQPIPESLEELLRLFVSWRQRQGNENDSDIFASNVTLPPPKWHRPGGYDK